jgi:hypothetical protein
MNSSEMKSVAKELQSITVGSPTHFGGLTIIPLFRNGSAPAEPDYTLLKEAIGRGTVRVTELSAGGSVPELRFENLGEEPVLLLDGEELVGAKQNRALNLTILAPSKEVIVIPVSCVEAGRWHAESDTFRPAERVMYARARAAKGAQVSLSMATSDSRRSDQSAIWDEIASKSERLVSRLLADASDECDVRFQGRPTRCLPGRFCLGRMPSRRCVCFRLGNDGIGPDGPPVHYADHASETGAKLCFGCRRGAPRACGGAQRRGRIPRPRR